ncbi:MAG: folylpolyglutamate synthase/dihydrofolate synthase family protein [Verrucomicrobiota bacterium]
MRYEDAIEWVYGTQLFGIKLGLENTERLLSEWGLPAGGQRVIHVAGTNGKGSVCAMVESVCRAGGYRTGLFTSPHLVTYRERVRVDFEMIGEEAVARLLSEIREVVAGWEVHPTFFELTTVLAMRYFAECECEVVVLETGMGGRLDATTGVMGRLVEDGGGDRGISVITRIGMDHEKWLGDTLEKVAKEKAGIMRPGVPVVSGEQAAEVSAELEAEAARVGTEIEFVEGEDELGAPGLAGRHQRENARLARAAVELAGLGVSDEAVAEGLGSVRWRGRFERVGEGVILDGAHNPDAMRALVATWREVFGEEKAQVVFGAVETKDVAGMLEVLLEIASEFVLVTVGTGRGIAAAELAGMAGELAGVACRVGGGLCEVPDMAEKGRVLVTGSLFLVGECLGVLGQGGFERSLQ